MRLKSKNEVLRESLNNQFRKRNKNYIDFLKQCVSYKESGVNIEIKKILNFHIKLFSLYVMDERSSLLMF
jgi:hypothetical protein